MLPGTLSIEEDKTKKGLFLLGYLVLRLLLSLLLVAVGLGLRQAGPAHLVWLESTVWGAAL